MPSLVLDTNVLVSALIAPHGIPALILGLILRREAGLYYDARILREYEEVINRPKFNFGSSRCRTLIGWINRRGFSIIAEPSFIEIPDETDRMFYEVAKTSRATLITGNLKHFPPQQFIVSPASFWQKYLEQK